MKCRLGGTCFVVEDTAAGHGGGFALPCFALLILWAEEYIVVREGFGEFGQT